MRLPQVCSTTDSVLGDLKDHLLLGAPVVSFKLFMSSLGVFAVGGKLVSLQQPSDDSRLVGFFFVVHPRHCYRGAVIALAHTSL